MAMNFDAELTTLRHSVLAIGALVLAGAAVADDCRLPPHGYTDWDLHVMVPLEPSSDFYERGQAIGRLIDSGCYSTSYLYVGGYAGDGFSHSWVSCRDKKRQPEPRHPRWTAEINYCPNGSAAPAAAPAIQPSTPPPKKPSACKSKDIERSWTRKSDGTNISIVGMGRGGGGSGIMNKSASKRWPRHVAKFFRIKQQANACEWTALCTTVHYNNANKGYNFSTEFCTLTLSADRKELTASGSHGTFTRGGK